MKKLFTIFATFAAVAVSARAEQQLRFYSNEGEVFDFSQTVEMENPYSGEWKTLYWEDRDLRNFDHVWLVYDKAEGPAIKFGLKYSEFVREESYGEVYEETTIAIESAKGVVGVELDHESVMEVGFREQKQLANGVEYTFSFIGDVFSQRCSQCYVQTALPDASINILGIYAGSAAEFEAAKGKNTPTTHIVVGAAQDGKVRSVATGMEVGPEYRGLVIKNGVKYLQK